MKRNLCTGFLLALTFIASGCGKSGSSGDSASTTPPAQTMETKQHQDTFIFRDADTNEVLPESEVPGRMFNAKYTYLSSTPKRWANGVIKWYYNPAGQPAGITTQQAVDGLIASTKKWEAICKVSFQYQGTTSNPLSLSGCDGNTVVSWAPLAGSVVGQTQACFTTTTIGEMDLALDNSQIDSASMMQEVAVHEFGHSFGLGHTDISPAVMTPYLTTGTPVQDDIDGCQSLYGPPSTTTAPAPVCTANTTRACSVTNGTGQQSCSADGLSWGSCKATSCGNGYTLSNGTCVAQSQPPTLVCKPSARYSCSSFTGYGYRTCNSSGSALSTCQITQCRSGYRMINGQCKRVY